MDQIHEEYLMDKELSRPMILHLVANGSRLYWGRSAGGRRTEFFNMQCILWRQRECYEDIQAVTDTQ